MRYTHNPIDGVAITLDDLRIFVEEMTGYRNLPGTSVVRGSGHLEIDLASGPRLRSITAETDDGPGGAHRKREHARPETADTGGA
jgi:hypothetical protein